MMITDFKLYENYTLNLNVIKAFYDNESNEDIINLIGDNDVNSFHDKDGKNILIVAIMYNKLDVVDYLLDNGIDINFTETRTHKTAIYFSCEKGFHGVSKKLIDKGINLNSQDKYGNTAIMRNVTFNYCENLFDLMFLKTDITLKDIYDNDIFELLADKTIEYVKEKYPLKIEEYNRNNNLNKYGI